MIVGLTSKVSIIAKLILKLMILWNKSFQCPFEYAQVCAFITVAKRTTFSAKSIWDDHAIANSYCEHAHVFGSIC